MFTDLVMHKVIDEKSLWRIYEHFRWVSEVDGFQVDVHAGRQTDLASIPNLPGIRWLFPVDGINAYAAVVHDELYKTGEVSRKEADGRFLEAMEELGVKWWRRRLMYRAVRLGGWASYNGDENE